MVVVGGGGGGLLDHGDVYWSGCACAVDFMVRHVVGANVVVRLKALEHQKRSRILTDVFGSSN